MPFLPQLPEKSNSSYYICCYVLFYYLKYDICIDETLLCRSSLCKCLHECVGGEERKRKGGGGFKGGIWEEIAKVSVLLSVRG